MNVFKSGICFFLEVADLFAVEVVLDIGLTCSLVYLISLYLELKHELPMVLIEIALYLVKLCRNLSLAAGPRLRDPFIIKRGSRPILLHPTAVDFLDCF